MSDNKPKLTKNLPEPPEVTEEMRQKILEEGRAWSKEYAKRAKDVTNLTAEDWKTRVR